MKHTLRITWILVTLFVLAQIVGLATVNKYIEVEETAEGRVIRHGDTFVGPQPEIDDKSYSAIPIIIAVLVGTGILFLLIRFKLGHFWRLWFFVAVFLTLAISFEVYIAQLYALILALILAGLKTFKPNIYVHNFTEIFIYTGITIVILPYLNLVSAFTLLVMISLYDMYAVWKSKHMIKLAKFQTQSKVFAGLHLNYDSKEVKSTKNLKVPQKLNVKSKSRSAILGGGDIAFPLLFSAAVMEHLILFQGLTKQIAFLQTTIITLFVTIALALLFFNSQKDKFYPAMPFLSAGCFLGYLVIWLIGLL